MVSYCDECGTRKGPAEENAFVCPVCGRDKDVPPRVCDYCHEHVASMPSDDGAWICDFCIMEALVGPAAMAEIRAIQERLTAGRGTPASLGDAFTEWRAMTSALKSPPTIHSTEVKTHVS